MSAQFVVMCPCCASVVDVERKPPEPDGHTLQEIECVGGCGQVWAMEIDPERFAAHSNF